MAIASGSGGEPFRVLLSCDSVGGVWTYALNLARGLTAAGHSVTLAVLGPEPNCAQRCEMEQLPGLELALTNLPLDWTASNAAEVRGASAALGRIATSVGADLVHLHAPALAAGSAFPVPVVATCHSCVGTWWTAVKGADPLPPDLAWRADLVREGCHAADALTAPTRAFARAVASLYGLAPAPIVVPNGCALNPCAPEAVGGETFVFAAGRLWDEAKNIELLDQAASSTSVPIIVAGATRGPNGTAIALPRLRCLGPLSRQEMEDRLAHRPIFASPALYEPFGLSVLEAASVGCPLILSDIPTFREIWADAAFLVDPRDPVAWADAINGLAIDPVAQSYWGARSFARAARFGLKPMVSGTLAVYRNMCAQTGGRRGRSAA